MPLLRAALTLAAVFGAVAYVFTRVVRPWYARWGATRDECRRSLPGDAIITNPQFISTRAVTIDAPAPDVWPWLVQIGYGRGGFYSYDWLENAFARLLGGTPGYRSADRILPEFQSLQPGDFIPSAPPDLLGGRVADVAGWTVEHLDPGRALVLRGWGAFVLEPMSPRRTRLIIRTRGDAPSFIGAWVAALLFWDPRISSWSARCCSASKPGRRQRRPVLHGER